MERMSHVETYESKLWAVLTKEHLVDLSQFHASGFSDEVPLFSRAADTAFLSEESTEKANGILVGFALKFLNSVVSYEEHRSPFVAAITVWSSAEDDRVIPNLFVWSGPIQRLQKKLVIGAPTTAFAKRIKKTVPRRHARNGFEVLQDTTTDPDETRVFISFSLPPYSGFVPLRKFSPSKIKA
jgi:hypothetical protein